MSPTVLEHASVEDVQTMDVAIDAVTLRKRAMEILASLKHEKAEATRAASSNKRSDALVKATGRSVFDRAIADVERTLEVLDRALGGPVAEPAPIADRVR